MLCVSIVSSRDTLRGCSVRLQEVVDGHAPNGPIRVAAGRWMSFGVVPADEGEKSRDGSEFLFAGFVFLKFY